MQQSKTHEVSAISLFLMVRYKWLTYLLILVGDDYLPVIGGLTMHRLLVVLVGIGAIVAVLLSFVQLFLHAMHYLKP
jgi:hypothetical protein